ncbi:hypothetical protein GCM10023115_25560 [Pontixanthobacter gangjinensis]|uniref:Class I SAM-dependent methyltransferase n=1 Tax=Christiangramia aestuarii TaxID=1028746 RepID=A0A7K1LMB3_9FLAO|nr:class I SAM-dependent methyltransferase [Christiangramia aestuarii]MUP41791.1 class I SAM-dependent methyltransferase [Christiangramia aestuarii]
MSKPREFYNNFQSKLISDYTISNKRMESAIINLGSFIPSSTENILDIGCGIGWSTHEFAKALPHSKVVGVDLSPVLINTASKLFSRENLRFETLDVTRELPENLFDIIVMIDVYEHIPKDNRQAFNLSLNKILSSQGRIIMACPSKFHQLWLQKNNPKGLQPVDEDIDFEVISRLSKDVNAEVTFFEYQNIWNQNDYFYAVLTKNPRYGVDEQFPELKLESKEERQARLKNQLKVEVKKNTNKNGLEKILSKLKKKVKPK